MNTKYQLLTSDTKTIVHPKTKLPVKLFRIMSLKAFNRGRIHIHEGAIGGYIQSEENLDTEDFSWVCHEALVFDKARLTENSVVMQKAAVFGNAILRNSLIQDFARVFENAKMKDSQATGNSDIYGNAELDFVVCENSSKVSGNAKLTKTQLYNGAFVTDDAVINNSKLMDVARVYGGSVLDNCVLKSAILIRDQNISNETLSRDIVLEQSYPEIQGQF